MTSPWADQAAPVQAAADEHFMALALALGRRNLGATWPNPSVGAVLVDSRDGRILATGTTQPGGRPHAEPIALDAAADLSRGATLYVSLEPCAHHGRSPPCTDRIIAAGVSRVVTALEDPDPRVAGAGHALLREAGIVVLTGIMADAARRAHRGHFTRVTLGRPAVTLKLAQTTDGYAGQIGSRLMITGERANARTHMLRAHSDAILIGLSTLVADDPALDVRLPGLEDRSPVRIILDSLLRAPAGARCFQEARERPTWVVCTAAATAGAERELARAGAQIIRVRAHLAGRVDLTSALQALAERGITRVLCEGGPTLANALAADDLLDELVLLTGEAPLGSAGLPALGADLKAGLSAFVPVSDARLGPDRIQVFERA